MVADLNFSPMWMVAAVIIFWAIFSGNDDDFGN